MSKKEPKVYFDLEIDKVPLGRIIIKLYPQYAPKTCENFRLLSTGEAGFSQATGKLLSYKGTIFHRIVPGFVMQGGDFTKFNGTGNESIYGEDGLPEENTPLTHSKRGIVSMAKNGEKTNGSQFFITFAPSPWLDGRFTAFGEVIEGFEICQKVENIRTDANDKPTQRVGISDCGEIKEHEEEKSRSRSRSREEASMRKRRSSSSSSNSGSSDHIKGEEEERRRRHSRSGSTRRKHRKYHGSGKSRHNKHNRSRSRDRHDPHSDSN